MHMKNALIFLTACLIFSTATFGQDLKNLDYVSPFYDGLAAINKGDQWAFINTEGTLVINYRSDLVAGKDNSKQSTSKYATIDYPFFNNGRCLIKKSKDGVDRYGYINPEGIVVIEPVYLDATPFNDNRAMVIEVYKELLGRNELLGKNVVTYSYNEVVIDDKGTVIGYLNGPFHLVYGGSTPQNELDPPSIESRFLKGNLYAVKTEKGTWEIREIKRK
jgi:hypothetical protein